jgi:uncharacterized protein (TIGR02594 family)
MQFKTRVLFAAGCVGLLAINIPAYSEPAPRGLEHQRNVQKKNITQRAPAPHADPRVAQANRGVRLVSMPMTATPRRPMFGWPVLVRVARKYVGTNPTARKRLWCATFMNMVLAKAGYAGTNSDAAKSFASYGYRISEPEVGAIAVLTRGNNGGHVGVVSGVDSYGNPIIISGNHGQRVGEAVYPRTRVIAYVMPSDRRAVSDTQVAERAMPNPQVAPSRAPSEHGIDSPITELLAAIEAEQKRSEATPVPLPAPPAPRLAVQQMPAPPAPHLIVQQMPERPPQAVPQMAQPLLSQRLAPLRAQPVPQRRHVASADAKIIRQ